MSREELIKQRSELRDKMNLVNEQIAEARKIENQRFVGKYYCYIDSDRTRVWFSVTGVDTAENVKTDTIVETIEGKTKSYSMTKDGASDIGYLGEEITKADFDLVKSVVASVLNTIL